jgi:dipeptide transport system permease protein
MTAEVLGAERTVRAGAPPGSLRDLWVSFRANRAAVFGLAVLVGLVVLALLADLIAPYSPYATNSNALLRPPLWQEGGTTAFLLGTDAIGRDVLSRLIHGARLSLLIGVVVVAISAVIGSALGLCAAFSRGALDMMIMRAMEVLLTLPSLLLAVVIVAVLGPGLMNAMLAVALVLLPHYVRIARAAAAVPSA